MKANWFHLQTILDLRASTLEKTRHTLGLAQITLETATNICNEARRKVEGIADNICSAAAVLTAADFQTARQDHLYHVCQANGFHRRVQECQENVQHCRAQVVNAAREHEILARFREKCLKAAQASEAQKEENTLNDLINSRHFQQRNTPPEELLCA